MLPVKHIHNLSHDVSNELCGISCRDVLCTYGVVVYYYHKHVKLTSFSYPIQVILKNKVTNGYTT